MQSSPLGQYAPLAATVASLGVIGAYILALILQGLGLFSAVDTGALDGLQNLALIAAGAVFGSAVAVNGWKTPLDAVHKRVDELEMATGYPTHDGNTPTPTV